MKCADAKSRMQPYTAGILSASDREEFEAHVGSCPGCSLELDLLRAGVTDAAGHDENAEPVSAPISTDASGTGEEATASASFVRSGDAGFRPEASDPATSEDVSFADIFSELQSAKGPTAEAAGEPPSIAAPAPPPAQSSAPPAQSSAPPVQEPAPTVRPAPVHPAAPVTAARKDWSFEPADAGTRTAPPAGSLFLAEESLSEVRHGAGARKKALPLRSVLWIAGGGVGLALLGLAGWMIWNSRPEIDNPARVAAQRYTTAAARVDAVPRADVSAPDAVAPSGPGTAGSAPEPASPAQEPSAATSAPQEPPATLAGLAAPSTAGETPALSGRKAAFATSPTRERKPAKTPATATPAGPSGTPGRHAAEGTPVAASGSAAPAPRHTEARPAAPPEVREESATSGATPAASAVSALPAAQPGPEPASDSAPPAPSPAATAPAPAAAAPEAAGPPATTEGTATPGMSAPAAPVEPALRPIDRIHMATVAAEERGDLQALRALRATWRTMVQRSGVGPDRTRAKRELADCLWAIQAITARRSDQRDALAAYRDYVINAPAGGADSRSIKRVQLLQDALSESN